LDINKLAAILGNDSDGRKLIPENSIFGQKLKKMTTNFVFENLVKYIAKNGTTESIKPVFKADDFCLYQNDCLTVMAKSPDNYVDMIFADPPYNLSNGGVTCYAGKMVSVNKGKWDKSKGFEADLEFHEKWISECKRILKPEGTIWISGTQHNISL